MINGFIPLVPNQTSKVIIWVSYLRGFFLFRIGNNLLVYTFSINLLGVVRGEAIIGRGGRS